MWVQCPFIFDGDFFVPDDAFFVVDEVVEVEASVKLTLVTALRIVGVPARAAAWLTVVTA